MRQIGNTFDPNVAGNVATPTAPTLDAKQAKTVGTAQTPSVGPGNFDPPNVAPTVDKPAYAATMAAVGDLIDDIMGKALATGQNLDVLLLEATAKMKEVIDKSNKDSIKNDQAAKRLAILERKAKLDEATEKIREAMENAKDGTIFDYVKSSLMMLTGLATIILGTAILLTVPGIGQLGGALLIGSGAITMGLAVDSMIGHGTGSGVAGNLAKALGADENQAAIADLVVRSYFGMSACVCGVAGGFVAPGSQVKTIEFAATLTTSAATIASSAGDITYQQYNYRSTQARAEAKNLEAKGKEIEAMMLELDKFIDAAITRLKGSGERFNEILDVQMEALKDFADTISNAKLTA